MPPSIKFCGLTRAEDAGLAAGLGAAYAGVIFAGGPRHISDARAADVLAGVPAGVGRVGVFAGQELAVIEAHVRRAGLTVAQLHARRPPQALREVRRALGLEVWAVVRVAGAALPEEYEALAAEADALVVDSYVAGQLGGTGAVADWDALAEAFARRGRPARLVLAGGLRPENVGRAIAALAPDVVDVSSGVEERPGVKDAARMAAFAAAATTLDLQHTA